MCASLPEGCICFLPSSTWQWLRGAIGQVDERTPTWVLAAETILTGWCLAYFWPAGPGLASALISGTRPCNGTPAGKKMAGNMFRPIANGLSGNIYPAEQGGAKVAPSAYRVSSTMPRAMPWFLASSQKMQSKFQWAVVPGARMPNTGESQRAPLRKAWLVATVIRMPCC